MSVIRSVVILTSEPMARCWFVVSLILLSLSIASAQNPPQSDPRAVALATQAMFALTNGIAVNDVTLSGNAVWTPGTEGQSGTATAYAKNDIASRLDLVLKGESRTELRSSEGAFPRGAWISADGKTTPSASHNCWTDAAWFFPALTSLSAVNRTSISNSPAKLVLIYVGLETRDDRPVQHIRSYQYLVGKTPRESLHVQEMSTVDYYLDAQTLVPLSLGFSVHPDNDASTNVAVEVEFSDYQQVKGILVPFHITKRWQGNPLLDLTVTNVAVNSGLPDNLFSSR
jgi:hypothetical protein